MDLGVGSFSTYEATDPASLALLVKVKGFELLFSPEDNHIPATSLQSFQEQAPAMKTCWSAKALASEATAP